MSKLKEYLKSELLLMPSYLKNGLLNEIKETNTVNDNEDIDTFLSRILENDMESFLVGYNHLEMRKSFKYSALFKLEDSRKISEVLDSIISDGDNSEGIANRQKEYSVSRIDDSIKVTFFLQGGRIENQEFVKYKTTYTVLVSFLEIDGNRFIEIDADNVATYFRNDDANFFTNMINVVWDWLRNSKLLTLEPIDLYQVLGDFKKEEIENTPQVSAQRMLLVSGSQATLDSADSETIILPILGELKQLIEDNDDLFLQAPDIKLLLENFIVETEDEADLPWITFTWDNRIKSKKIQIKFVFSDQEYTLLNYYHHSRGRGGMYDATKCLLKKYCEIQNG